MGLEVCRRKVLWHEEIDKNIDFQLLLHEYNIPINLKKKNTALATFDSSVTKYENIC